MQLVLKSLALSSSVLAHQRVLAAKDIFDFIIVGGGTSGLVLANRLSEDPGTSVAVIEAGGSVQHNPNVTQIENLFASLGLGSDIDWQYESQPQTYANGKPVVYDSGKALGGTSTINGATYVRAQKAQIDAWEKLGIKGWNWESLMPYYKKSENLQPPSPSLRKIGAEYEPAVHGFDGPLDVGWSKYIMKGTAHEVLNETWQALGLPFNKDQSDGELRGFAVWPSTIDSVRSIRADAARSYYWPISERKNLHAFTNTLAEKLIWKGEGDSGSLACASGVQFRPFSGGESRVLQAEREVIVSAGSLKSPVILENSGVGNPAILSKHGIATKVNLPTVGENLQDQPNVLISAEAKTPWSGYTPFVTFATASDLFGSNTSHVENYVRSQIPSYAATIVGQAHNAYSTKMVEEQLRIQANIIFDQQTPIFEAISVPTNVSMISAFWAMLPFSRGSVHLSDTNASSTPLINPNFFMLDWDAMLETAGSESRQEGIPYCAAWQVCWEEHIAE